MITCFFAFSAVERALAILDEAGSAHVAERCIKNGRENQKGDREAGLESHNYIQCTASREPSANLRNRARGGRYTGRSLF